jgi:hypothetical protein
MTTGCTCGTAGCSGVAAQPGGRCPGCQTAAMPPGAARTLREILQAALYGRDISADAAATSRAAGKEAGS